MVTKEYNITTNKTPTAKTAEARMALQTFYLNKFYSLWMAGQRWNGFSFEQNEFANEQLWSVGAFAIFNLLEDAKDFTNTDKPFALCPFAPSLYNIYNYPIDCYLVNLRGVSFIPSGKRMIVGRDVELCYAQHNRMPIRQMVDIQVERIVNVEMTIRTQLYLRKMPYVLKSTPENERRLRLIFEALENDAPCLSITAEDMNDLDVLTLASPAEINDLYTYKVQLENELLTFLGIDNIGSVEKKERLIKDEANSNNDIINDFGDAIAEMLEGFCERANKTLGTSISVNFKNTPQSVEGASRAPKEGSGQDGEQNL